MSEQMTKSTAILIECQMASENKKALLSLLYDLTVKEEWAREMVIEKLEWMAQLFDHQTNQR